MRVFEISVLAQKPLNKQTGQDSKMQNWQQQKHTEIMLHLRLTMRWHPRAHKFLYENIFVHIHVISFIAMKYREYIECELMCLFDSVYVDLCMRIFIHVLVDALSSHPAILFNAKNSSILLFCLLILFSTVFSFYLF